jgi:peroxiredoxin
MGKVNFPVTTTKPEAQAFVTQGVAQLHSFFYFEAERSFRQAALIDPDGPMAYWGMAMANVNNAKRAKGFVKEAKAKVAKTKVTRREQLYLDSLDVLYKEGGSSKANQKEHLLILESIVAEFPDDLDARAWMAMVAWQNAGADTSRQALDVTIESVLDKEPLHPGAQHYRIHLWDHQKPARAEKAAALYAKAAPGIAHAWHMPGHTYTELKRYADAAYQQEGSARVDHAYMIRDRVMPFEIHNYAHNNQWLATSLGHVGRARDAIVVARNLVEQPRDPQKNGPNDGGSPQRSGRIRWAETLAKFELWDDLIAATTSGALDWADIPAEKVDKPYYLALAYHAKRDQPHLAEQVAILKTIAEAKNTGDRGTAPAALAELEGYQKLERGEALPALESFAKATAMRPEALARAHLRARNFGFAESAARASVDKQPEQVVPLATLVEVLNANGKGDDAIAAYRKLEPLARSADRDTPIFRRLEPIVAAWSASGKWKPTPEPATEESAAAGKVALEPLGPLAWSPWAAPGFSLSDTEGKPWTLAEHRGRNVVILFYLGGKCAHCMQQLVEFGKQKEAFARLETDVVAIGTDPLDAARALKANADGIKFPMPFLPDPDLGVFKLYQAYDDFESQPLHGAFLVDARGQVRFQRISADPFLDVEFLKVELARVNRMIRSSGEVRHEEAKR